MPDVKSLEVYLHDSQYKFAQTGSSPGILSTSPICAEIRELHLAGLVKQIKER